MARSLRLAVAIGLLAALVIGTQVASASPGPGLGHGRTILNAPLAGLPSAGLVLAGVTGAGHPWAIEHGRAKLSANGHLDLNVHGLVLTLLPPAGGNEGTNPIPSGIAIVSCNGGADIATSTSVPFSVPDGDAHVNQTLSIPASCLAPVVFFGVPGSTPKWFAVSGD